MKAVEVGMARQVFSSPVVPTIGITAVEVVWLRIWEKHMLAEFRVFDAKGVIFIVRHAVPIIDELTPG